MGKLVALDIETTGLHHKTSEILCLAAYCDGKSRVLTDLKEIQKFANSIKDFTHGWHGGKFDIKHLRNAGITGLRCDVDSLVMASLFKFEEKGLKELGMQVLGEPDWSVNRKKMAEMDAETRNKYCIKDAEITYKLILALHKQIEGKGLSEYLSKLMALYTLLIDVEMGGVAIDTQTLEAERSRVLEDLRQFEEDFGLTYYDLLQPIRRRLIDAEFAKIKVKTPEAIERNKRKIEEGFSFNLNSPIQVAELLKDIKVSPRDKKGKFTTSSKSLRYHVDRHPVIPDLIRYRGIVKVSQFLTSWHEKAVDGHLYGTYNVHTVDTGRLSSSEPNLQQVPKDSSLRGIFKAEQGKVWVIADYAQIEPRMMAHFTEDPALVKVFREDIDIYAYLATRILGCNCELGMVKERYPQQRQVAKALTLAIMYGMGAKALSYHLTVEQGIPTTKDQARGYINAFYNHFSAIGPYQERLGYEAFTHGFIVGFNGRRLWLPKAEARHKAFNYINQNAASEICAFNQVQIQKELEGIAKLKLLTHDEVCYECRDCDTSTVISCLNRVMVDDQRNLIKVPLKLDIKVGTSWAVKEE